MTRDQFNRQFEEVKPQLRSNILRMTASAQDTEDLLQDTCLKGSEKIDTFRGEASLKTWIFSIASNLTIDNLRKKKRWPENVTDLCKEAAKKDPTHFRETMQLIETSDYAKFEIREHIAFCFTCIAKSLPLELHHTFH